MDSLLSIVSSIIFWIIVGIIIICAMLLPVYAIYLAIRKLLTGYFKRRKPVNRTMKLIFEILGTIVIPILSFLVMLSTPGFDEKVVIQMLDIEPYHTPIDKNSLMTVAAFYFLANIFFWVAKISKGKLPPIISVLCIIFVFEGILTDIVLFIQFLPGLMPVINHFNTDRFLIAAINVIFMAYFYLYPVQNALILLYGSREFYDSFIRNEKQKNKQFENRFLNYIYNKTVDGTWYSNHVIFLAFFPVVILQILVLKLFGQQPDSYLQAFVRTSDWTFSKMQPLPAEYSSPHYLCNVALRGHKGIVKPVRMGLRRGQIIKVNRQLLIANAFESLIEENTPRIHRIVRRTYDRIGIPVYKWVYNPYIADIIYFLMKPLEYFFLIALYLLDEKPENRINTQYLPRTFKSGDCND